MFAFSVLVELVLVSFYSYFVQGGTQPYCSCIDWPKYVTPNDSVACTCRFISYQKSWSLQWRDEHGHVMAKNTSGTEGQTLTLSLPAKELVTKAKSGQPYTRINCSVYDAGGVPESLVHSYVPHVAYGPHDVDLTFSGEKPYVQIEGSKMTLTCSAKASPVPIFKWPEEAVRLRNCSCDDKTVSETVSLDPRLFKDGDVISCEVKNSAAELNETKDSNLTIHFGPSPSGTVSQDLYNKVVGALCGTLLALLVMSVALAVLFQKLKHVRVLLDNREQQADMPNTGNQRQEPEQNNERQPLLHNHGSLCDDEEVEHLKIFNESIDSSKDVDFMNGSGNPSRAVSPC